MSSENVCFLELCIAAARQNIYKKMHLNFKEFTLLKLSVKGTCLSTK